MKQGLRFLGLIAFFVVTLVLAVSQDAKPPRPTSHDGYDPYKNGDWVLLSR